MKNYKIKVMAHIVTRGTHSQILVKEIQEQTDDFDRIDIGRVSDYYVLDKDSTIELWISSEPAETAE